MMDSNTDYPATCSINIMNVPDASSSSNSTLNPFEADSVDSLHLTQFSPSVFAKSAATPASSKKSGKFRWSIDHLAVLHPADIDEHPVQQESMLDSDTEERAQQAIKQFFSQQHVVPSPWSVKRPIKHVTFSPNPPTVSEAEDDISIVELPVSSSQENESSKQQQEKVEVSCQTAITLPLDFDLLTVLGEYFNFEDRQFEDNSELSTSTLRRKLFSQGEASPTISPVGMGLGHQPSPDRIPDIPSPQVSPIKQVDDSTLSASDISQVKTPGSGQSQFSSSPISSKLTPRRWSSYDRGSLTSSGLIHSPSFSPISSTVYRGISDCRYPSCNSDASKAPPCDMMLPDASPILASASQSKAGMMSPFLTSVEMTSMSFSTLEDKSSPDQCADAKDEKSFTSLPLDTDRSFLSDTSDDGNCEAPGDVQLSSYNGSSVCSMEQSYLTQSSKCSEELSARQPSDRRNLGAENEDMMNTRSMGLCVCDGMMSSRADRNSSIPVIASERQLTSTLRFKSCALTDSGRNVMSTTSTMIPETLQDDVTTQVKRDYCNERINKKTMVAMETAGQMLPTRSKITHKELVVPMQSDSGFNTQSFTSMEVSDNEVTDLMHINEYSTDDCPIGNKENIIKRKGQEVK